MTQLESCRQILAEISAAIAAMLPPNRARALLALLRAGDTIGTSGDHAQPARPGWNLALRLCLAPQDDQRAGINSDDALFASRADQFLADCDQLALANQALAQCASGHLQLQQRAVHTFVAWPTSRRLSPEQRERADFNWWSAHVALQVAPRIATVLEERHRIRALLDNDNARTSDLSGYVSNDPAVARYYHQLGQAHVARFACQHSYPADAAIGGATFIQFTEILALLIGWLHRERDRRARDGTHTPMLHDEHAVIAALAHALDADQVTIERTLQPFILDRENADYHSALPGRAAPPLIRLDGDRIAWSAHGLLGEPLIFLARELRRRHAQEYHNSAYLREGVFRQDLYRLFNDRRFALSAGRVELKRSGEARTDLDALIFDRKTGTLGVFELKAQDPFARTAEERQRQCDNFFHANRQVSAILEWAQRHGPDDLLARFDERAAKKFHVQNVYVFVLGRYLAHFAGGPEPDHRAAWGSWPEVLQIVGDGPVGSDHRNPLSALFARLRAARPPSARDDADSEEISVGDFRLHVFPSYADMRADEARAM